MSHQVCFFSFLLRYHRILDDAYVHSSQFSGCTSVFPGCCPKLQNKGLSFL